MIRTRKRTRREREGERAPALGRSDDAHAGRRGRSRVTLASSPSSEGIFVDYLCMSFVSRRWYLRRHPVTAAASAPAPVPRSAPVTEYLPNRSICAADSSGARRASVPLNAVATVS